MTELVKSVISLVKTTIFLVKTATVSVDNAPDPGALPPDLMTSATVLVKSVRESVKTATILVITGGVKYFTLKHSGHVFRENIV